MGTCPNIEGQKTYPIVFKYFNHAVSPLTQNENSDRAEKSPGTGSHRRKLTLGYLPLPMALNDTAHISILNVPAEHDGAVTEVKIKLGGTAPGDGSDWEVRVYSRDGGSLFLVFPLPHSSSTCSSLTQSRLPPCYLCAH